MSDSENTIRLAKRSDYEDGSVTVEYEVVSPEGEVLATFTGRAGPDLAEKGESALLEAGRRLHDPRMNNRV